MSNEMFNSSKMFDMKYCDIRLYGLFFFILADIMVWSARLECLSIWYKVFLVERIIPQTLY